MRHKTTIVRGLIVLTMLLLSATGSASDHGSRYTLEQLGAEIMPSVTSMPVNQAEQDTRWKKYQRRDRNQGISDQHFWLRFTLHNTSAEPHVYLLSSEISYLDHLVIYQRPQGQQVFDATHLSDRVNFEQRPLAYRTLALPLTIAPQSEQEIYIQAYNSKPDSVTLGFALETPPRFGDRMQRESLGFGFFYGALSIMLMMSLIFAIALKQRNAAYYALFLASTLLFWLMLNGTGFQYVWPNAVWWHNEGFHIVYMVFVVSALQFSKSFLQLPLLTPRLCRLFSALQLIALAAVALRLLGWYQPVLVLSYCLLATLALVIPVASFIVWRKGLGYALWSLLAWLLYAGGLILSIISAATSVFSWGMTPLFYAQVASLLETLFLMVGLSKWLIQLELERQKAITLANEDPLTGLGNRRRLQLAFTQLRDTMMKDQRPAFVLMIDLDHFKRINDTYGHDAGDRVLSEVGSLLLRSCRESDVVTRYGGEEFAILLRAVNVDAAVQIAERIRTEFEASPTQYFDEKIHHTLCCGIAEIMNTAQQPSVQEMMQHADEALYQAKAAGRNQCLVYAH